MANILLTQRCVRSCPYCFAKEHMSRSALEATLSWEDLIYLADLIQISGEHRVSLLGGEPTIHPEFVNYVAYLLERKIGITVFTSGIVPPRTLEDMTSAFRQIPEQRLSFVCNLNDPHLSPPTEFERIGPFLEEFGPRTVPGFNIYRPDFSLDFLFDYINRYGMVHQIRMGLAHPIPGAKNAFVSIEDIRTAMDRLVSYAPSFRRFRVVPSLDCGFPLCAFTDEQLGMLYRIVGDPIRFGCSPAFDIGPDMSVWCCFPLSTYHKKSVFEFNSIGEIVTFYREKLRGLRIEAGGLYEDCDECTYREEGKCAGGCAAHLLSRFRNEERTRMEEIYK
ncbi:MAG: hypothetical protein A2X56_05465 [Nitrospirae bacterium GWC2_57_13]|jgi:hypothetical protein|nr:MAG: hypothetical protein A2X56_05465 [Nitrospirae bacterium GWC2_57_13]